ncbi:hypothetical protein I5L79_03330 [Hymenobacter sp. BT594]|uniref:Uncharacterized protein n=2 Tax=Hymenobacter guriensis TaxID=2793065 RepID=A0ABS0KXI6_9BACT|nr:hypothetical protein [Hymenobacter guriensis]
MLPSRPSSPSSNYGPIWVNLFFALYLLAILFGKSEPDAGMLFFFELLVIVANLLGIVVSLLQRKWALAVWYGLALAVMTACVLAALEFIPMLPLET